MATTAQLQQDLINAVAKLRVQGGQSLAYKFSDGKTRDVYFDGSYNGDNLPNVDWRSLKSSFDSAEQSLRNASAPKPATTTPAATPAAAPVAQSSTTPISQVGTTQQTVQTNPALQNDLINAVAKLRVQGGQFISYKFSDGKTRDVYFDGSYNGDALPGVDFRALKPKFEAAEAALKGGSSTTPVSQVGAQQTTTPSASTTSGKISIPGANPDYFPNVNAQGLPILNQKALDDVLAKYKTDTLDKDQYRDNYNKFGWNVKSDGSQVLHGAAAFGLKKNIGVMGSPDTYTGDFNKAAQQLGIDVSGLRTPKEKYDAINAAAKDYYVVQNSLDRSGKYAGQNTASPHASILFKADGSGNLVPVTKPDGSVAANYFNATSNVVSNDLLGDLAPFIGMAGLAFGVPAIMNAIGAAGVGSGTWAAANAAAGLGTASAGTIAADVAAIIGGAGAVDAAIGAGQVFTSGGLAGSPAATGAGSALAGLSADQIMAMNPEALADEIVKASDLGSQTFPSTVNASTIPGATVPAIQGGTSLSSMLSNAGTSALKFLGLGQGATTADVLNNAAKLGLIGSAGQALGSYLGASGQADAAKQAAANQMAMFNTINQQYAPQRGAGYQALNQIRSMLPGQYTTYGETGQPTGTAAGTDFLTRQFTPQDLYAGLAPNYQFQLQQGQMANQRAANLAGGALSGNTLAGLQRYTQDYAGNAYQQAFQNFQNQRGNIYNTLAGIAGLGQQAIGGSAQAGQAATTAAGQLGVGAAAANAAGMTGAANAVAGGLQNYQLNQVLQQVLAQNQNVAQQNQGV